MLGKTTIFLNSFEAANDLLHKKSSIYSDRPRLVMLNEVYVFLSYFFDLPLRSNLIPELGGIGHSL